MELTLPLLFPCLIMHFDISNAPPKEGGRPLPSSLPSWHSGRQAAMTSTANLAMQPATAEFFKVQSATMMTTTPRASLPAKLLVGLAPTPSGPTAAGPIQSSSLTVTTWQTSQNTIVTQSFPLQGIVLGPKRVLLPEKIFGSKWHNRWGTLYRVAKRIKRFQVEHFSNLP